MKSEQSLKIADYFEKKEGSNVKCCLCPHLCLISPGKSGICGARTNSGGELISRNYGVVSSLSFDPIEKKPLYHYYPGGQILSIGTVGCNLHCPFCQNYSLSRYCEEHEIDEVMKKTRPSEILELLNNQPKSVFGGAAYTYSEPMVWYEYVMETSRLLRENGYKNVLVTNGYINPEPLKALLKLTDAANIDLKAFTDSNYRKLGGRLKPVLESIGMFKEAGVHIELTTLVVTAFNDNMEEMEALAKWVAKLDSKVPLHLSRYFPQYKYHEEPTSLNFLHEVYEMAKAHLDYVYLGNTHSESDTRCPECGNVLVERQGYDTSIRGIAGGKCMKCGRKADLIIEENN
jgi:pyruvate formate lyase activating enzyme